MKNQKYCFLKIKNQIGASLPCLHKERSLVAAFFFLFYQVLLINKWLSTFHNSPLFLARWYISTYSKEKGDYLLWGVSLHFSRFTFVGSGVFKKTQSGSLLCFGLMRIDLRFIIDLYVKYIAFDRTEFNFLSISLHNDASIVLGFRQTMRDTTYTNIFLPKYL